MKAPRWASDVGANDAVKWPTGIGGRSLRSAADKAGRFVAPAAANFAAAAAGAKWNAAPGFYLLLLD